MIKEGGFDAGPKPEKFDKDDMAKFRSKVKVIGGECMVFGVNEKEASDIEGYAKEKGVDVQRTDLADYEMSRHGVTDPDRKFGIVLGHTVGSEKKLFDE